MRGPATLFHHIPVEILLDIFSYLPIISKYPDEAPPYASVSQVCKHWAMCAQSCRELWTIMPIHSYGQTERALKYSSPYPIVLRANMNERNYCMAALEVALVQASRICELTINEFGASDDLELERHVESLLENVSRRRMPALKIFHANTPGHRLHRHTSDDDDALPWQLRSVIIHAEEISRRWLLPPFITNLELHCRAWASREELIETLDGLHCLEYLTLLRALPADTSVGPPPHYAQLPMLKTLRVVGDAHVVTPFLFQWTRFSAKTTLDIDLCLPSLHENVVRSWEVILGPFATLLAIHCSEQQSSVLTFSDLRIESRDGACKVSVTRPLSPPLGEQSNEFYLPPIWMTLTFETQRKHPRIIRRILRLARILAPSPEHLAIVTGVEHWGESWFTLPWLTACTRSLTASGEIAHMVTQTLCCSSGAFVPALERFVLLGPCSGNVYIDDDIGEVSLLDGLEVMLTWRSSTGCVLRRLVLDVKYSVTDDILARLKDFTEVVFDDFVWP